MSYEQAGWMLGGFFMGVVVGMVIGWIITVYGLKG